MMDGQKPTGEQKVIKQQNWTDKDLETAGFKSYERKREVVMARELPDSEAPMMIQLADNQILKASAGYMICYTAGDEVHPHLEDYDHWPVEPKIFEETYSDWPTKNWTPTPAQAKLMELGCAPYYKSAEVWAKQADESGVYVQSLEDEKPVEVDKGDFVAIGAEGEPYAMGETTFLRRYQPTRQNLSRLFNKLLKAIRIKN